MALRRSLSWAPWNVLRLVVPRGKRFFSGVLILCADGELEGPRGEELQKKKMFAFVLATVNEKDPDVAANLALSSVLSSMGGSVLFDGCPDDDMDLV